MVAFIVVKKMSCVTAAKMRGKAVNNYYYELRLSYRVECRCFTVFLSIWSSLAQWAMKSINIAPRLGVKEK